MKAKDLTPADANKWVTLRAQIADVLDGRPYARIEGVIHDIALPFDTIFEFTDPPAPVQKVGDVFSHFLQKDEEWTIAAIALDGNSCLMTCNNFHQSSRYPLHDGWTLVRKGTQP